METNKTQNLDMARADIYKAVSLLFYQPSDEMGDYLIHLKDCLQELYPELAPIVDKMQTSLSLAKNDLTQLQVDHAKLFIGPFDVLAIPYSSVYLDGQRQVMGDSTLKVLEYYQEAGLELSGDINEVPDHISLELEFMYYVTFKALETGDKEFIAKRNRFLEEHLGLWVNPFTNFIIERAETDFYKNLGLITKEFIGAESKGLM